MNEFGIAAIVFAILAVALIPDSKGPRIIMGFLSIFALIVMLLS